MNFWKDIGANDFILDTIENGYKLPLIQTPEPAVFKNNKSALANPEFVTEAIQELVSTNRVLEVPFRPKVENPSFSSKQQGQKPAYSRSSLRELTFMERENEVRRLGNFPKLPL